MLWIISRHSLYSSDEFVPCVGKYALMMHIFLGEDLNGTLLQSRMNKHDRLLKELIRELDLTTNIGIGSQSTFFHHAHNSKSQIDYRNIFFSEAIALIEPKLCVNHWKVLYKLCVFYVDCNSKMTTTAGHSFCIGPIGSFYYQVNGTDS
jgi:hypothetical protein